MLLSCAYLIAASGWKFSKRTGTNILAAALVASGAGFCGIDQAQLNNIMTIGCNLGRD